MHRRRVLAATAALVAVAGTSCSTHPAASGNAPAGAGSQSTSSAAVTGTITVFAAASLQEAFTSIARMFEAAHPGTRVKLDFAASSALATQITQGAPADVFASAAPKNMSQVVSAGAAATSTNFARNVMEIAVPPANPARVSGVVDLARTGVTLALCQPQVPCGATASQVFTHAGLTVRPVTLEADVKSVLAKVELGEVDAGVVYVTDVRAAGSKVRGIAIPAATNAATEYPIAALTRAANPAGARAFLGYVLSPAGRAVLTADGFEQP